MGPSQMNHQIPPAHWGLLIVPLHTHSHTDADVHTMNNTTLMVISHFTSWHYSCPVRCYRLDRRFVSVSHLDLIDGGRLEIYRVCLFGKSWTLCVWGLTSDDSDNLWKGCMFCFFKRQVLTPSHFNCPVHNWSIAVIQCGL